MAINDEATLHEARRMGTALHLEFRAGPDLTGHADKEKQEFLRTITSFANTIGGQLIYGVAPHNSSEDVPPLQSLDQREIATAIAVLAETARQGIDPPLIGLDLRQIELSNGLLALVVQVERSLCAPHMVSRRGENRFYARDHAGLFAMSACQVHDAVLRADAPVDRADQWRRLRVDLVDAGEGPCVRLTSNRGRLFVHVVPILDRQLLDLSSEDVFRALKTLEAPSGGRAGRTLFDGYVTADSFRDEVESYSLWFYDGRAELLKTGLCWQWDNSGTQTWLTSPESLQEAVVAMVKRAVEGLVHLGGSPPFAVCVTLTGFQGVEYRLHQQYYSGSQPGVVDRQRVEFPITILDCIPRDYSVALLQCLDRLWQAGGHRCSPRTMVRP